MFITTDWLLCSYRCCEFSSTRASTLSSWCWSSIVPWFVVLELDECRFWSHYDINNHLFSHPNCENAWKGFPICDNALLHGTAPVAPAAPHNWNNHGAWNWNHHAAPAPAAHAYNHWNGPLSHYDFYDSNDIQGPGGDKWVIVFFFFGKRLIWT